MISVDRLENCDQTDLDERLMFEPSLALADNLLLDVEDDDDHWRPHSGLESLKCSYVTWESAHDSRTWSNTHTHTHSSSCCVLPWSLLHNARNVSLGRPVCVCSDVAVTLAPSAGCLARFWHDSCSTVGGLSGAARTWGMEGDYLKGEGGGSERQGLDLFNVTSGCISGHIKIYFISVTLEKSVVLIFFLSVILQLGGATFHTPDF